MGVLLLLWAQSSAGQCGSNLGTRSYDTLLTGIGYGNYTINFPQWNADSGTLISVRIRAVVNLQYGFTLTNADITPSIYTVLVGRYDQITSPAMTSMYDSIIEVNMGAFPLSPGASVSRPPFNFLQNYTNTDSITGQIASFIGTGALTFAYSPITYSDVHTNNNSSYSFSATAKDSIHFSITYQFCNIGVLASSLIRFIAAPSAPSAALLSWTMANEEKGRQYEIEHSEDGLNFTTVASMPSLASGVPGNADYGNADYTYTDHLPSGTQGKWYFRLKIEYGQGGFTYSAIKSVIFGSCIGSGLILYPDPATDHVNIVFDPEAAGGNAGAVASGEAGANAGTGGDWQVEVFSADGRLIQKEIYSNMRSVRMNFRQKPAPGAYFVRATDLRTGHSATSSFLEQ
jgi:hypothetical protein